MPTAKGDRRSLEVRQERRRMSSSSSGGGSATFSDGAGECDHQRSNDGSTAAATEDNKFDDSGQLESGTGALYRRQDRVANMVERTPRANEITRVYRAFHVPSEEGIAVGMTGFDSWITKGSYQADVAWRSFTTACIYRTTFELVEARGFAQLGVGSGALLLPGRGDQRITSPAARV